MLLVAVLALLSPAHDVQTRSKVSHLQNQTTEMGRHLISQSAIFPRLSSSLEEAKGKLLPKLTEFVTACKVSVQAAEHVKLRTRQAFAPC